MKRFLLILLRIAIGLMALVLIVAALSQTQFFRDRIRSYAIEGLQSALDAEIVVGDLRGNLIAGFSLDSLSINVDGIAVVSTNRVEIHYNLLRLPGRHISFGTVILVQPTVRLLANRSGVWNVQQMLRDRGAESPDSAGAATAAPWAIEVQDLEIRDGRVLLLDSAWVESHPEDPGAVDYQNFVLRNVNCALSGRIAGGEKQVAIKRFSCTMEQPSIQVRDLLLTAQITPTETNIELLHLRTDRSSVTFTGKLEQVDLLGGISLSSLKKKPVRATLALDPLDLAELRQFLPAVSFLDGTVGGVLAVKGEFGRLEVERFDLLHGMTALHLRGTIENLHHPSDLSLNIQMEQNSVDGGDVRALLPGLDLPDLRAIGVANFSLRFSGRPLEFTAGGIIATDAGTVEIPDLALRVGGPGRLAYKGNVVFRGVNLASVVGDPGFESNLSGSARADGMGTSFATLLSSFEIRLDSSSFLGEPITDTWCSVGVREKRLLGRIQGELGQTRAELTARLDENQDGVSAFMLNGEMSGLNLARVFRDQRYDSDIGVKIDASGSGLTWDELDGTLLLDFSQSRYRDYTLDSAYLQFTVTPLDSNRKLLTVGSQMLDVVVEGVFTPASFFRYARYYALAIRQDVSERLAPVDTTFRDLIDPRQRELLAAEIARGGASPDASFTFQLKSLDPLATILGGPKITGTGIVSGEFTGRPEELKLSSRLQLDEFAYGNEEQGGVFVDRADLAIATAGITPSHPLEKADFRLVGTMDRMAINKSRFESLNVDLRYAAGRSEFTAGFNSEKGALRVDVGGTSRLARDTIAITLDRLGASYEGYAWQAQPGMQIDISGGGLHVRDGVLARGSEKIAFDGALRGGSSVQGTLRASGFDLDAVKYVLEEQSPGVRRAFFSGTADVALDLSGSLSDPRYRASVRAHDVLVRDMLLGEVEGDLTYADHSLNGRVTAADRSGSPPQLVVEGGIPMNLDLTGDAPAGIANQPADLTIRAGRFQLAALDPFLPAFDEFVGSLDADLRLTGPIRNPRYAGTFSVADGSFLFEPNNIRYTFNGDFRASGERIEVIGVNVRNLDEDALEGKVGAVTITGDLSLKSFRPGEFNLTVRGDLLVVKESTRSSSLEVSGALFGEIDPAGLRFTGEIEHSLLKGAVAIRNSALVLPPTQNQSAEQSATSVPVVFIDDTTRVVTQRRKAAEQYFTGRGEEVSGEDETPTVSFMDGLAYDLQVEAPGGSTTIEMIFNSLTAEKLVATINGRWTIRGSKSHWLGELTISQAYYNFLKRFEAEGRIRYTGDILNPSLDIVATYRGQRPTQDSTGRLFERIVVTFKITGTKQEPKIETQMTIDDLDYAIYPNRSRTSNDVQSDAIQFIVYGNFPLNATEKTEANSDLEKQLGFSAITGATTMLTGALSEFLRTQTGFISSVDFSYGTAGRPAVIRLSGSALNGYWRFGGRIVDEPLTNADFSLMYSFEALFGTPELRNLMFEFERKVETSSLQLNDLKRVNSARLFYRFSF